MAEKSKGIIDEDLQSRQLAVHGKETQAKLSCLRVFLHGLRGVGIETAKNLILAGPKSLTIHDDDIAMINDLASNFYISENEVGKKTRSEICFPHLSKLNPYTQVAVKTGDIQPEDLADFDVVVFTDYYDKEKLIKFNNFCRNHYFQPKPIGFIYGGALGLYCFAFVDFGPKFMVLDKDGEEPRNAIVVKITNEAEGVVFVHEEKRHGFAPGDHVTFKEVQGMDEINGKVYPIKLLKDPYSFSIGDTTKFGEYRREGIVTQVKVPIEKEFASLENSLLAPMTKGQYMLENPCMEKDKRPEMLHVALNEILDFYSAYHCLPKDAQDAAVLVEMAKKKKEELVKVEKEGKIKLEEALLPDVIKNVALYARAQISPIASFLGGVIGQEVVKYTGKYSPLYQWLHLDFFESLPTEQVDRTLANCRYDDMILIFGKELTKKLQSLKYKNNL